MDWMRSLVSLEVSSYVMYCPHYSISLSVSDSFLLFTSLRMVVILSYLSRWLRMSNSMSRFLMGHLCMHIANFYSSSFVKRRSDRYEFLAVVNVPIQFVMVPFSWTSSLKRWLRISVSVSTLTHSLERSLELEACTSLS